MSSTNTYKKAGFFVVLTLLAASFVNTMGGIVNPAIASLAAAYPTVGLSTIMLVSTLPMFTAIPTSLLAGKIIGKLGAKRCLIYSYALFVVSCVAPAFFKTSFTPVLVCRAISGIPTGLVNPLNSTLVTTYMEPERRSAMFGYKQSVGMAVGIGLMALAGIIAAKNVFNLWYLHLILCIPLFMAFFLPKAPVWDEDAQVTEAGKAASDSKKEKIPAAAWEIIVVMLIFSIFSYPVFLYLSPLVEANGMGDASLAGFISTLFTIGGVVAGLIFAKLYAVTKKYIVPISFVVLIINYMIFAMTSSVPLYYFGNFVGGIAYSVMFVALTTGLSINCPPSVFPTAAGIMGAMMNIGIFASSYTMDLICKIAGQAGSLTFPLIACSAVFAVLAVILSVKPLKM